VRPLPVILHGDELQALFAAFVSPKFRALFMTCYAAGLPGGCLVGGTFTTP
jgi:hypothetical protein